MAHTVVRRRDPATQSEGVVAGYAQTTQRWPSEPLVRRPHTVAELSGARGIARRLAEVRGDLAGHGENRALGQLIQVRARVVDEDGAPVAGAVVEIWHCNAAGKYIHPNDSNDAPADPNFYGAVVEIWHCNAAGKYIHHPVPDTDGWWRPPHIHFSVFGRVWLSRLVTQMFFPGEPLNETDAILNAIGDAGARKRCIARFVPSRGNALVYEHQLVVRGRVGTPSMP
jgi:protocatechuate 3,4-dioxygenase, beta subunit